MHNVELAQQFLSAARIAKNAYKWTNNGNADYRALQEKRLSFPHTCLILNGWNYEVELTVKMTRRHAYVKTIILRNGGKVSLQILTYDMERERFMIESVLKEKERK